MSAVGVSSRCDLLLLSVSVTLILVTVTVTVILTELKEVATS